MSNAHQSALASLRAQLTAGAITQAEYFAKEDELRASQSPGRDGTITPKIGPAGGVSVYGLQKQRPFTFYAEQLLRFNSAMPNIVRYLAEKMHEPFPKEGMFNSKGQPVDGHGPGSRTHLVAVRVPEGTDETTHRNWIREELLQLAERLEPAKV